MKDFYISEVAIKKVRHLQDVKIQLPDDRKKNLIITGKNGSGKTSLLEAMATYLDSVTKSDSFATLLRHQKKDQSLLEMALKDHKPDSEINEVKKRIASRKDRILTLSAGVELETTASMSDIREAFENGKFITSYYRADRIFKAQEPKHVEKVELKKDYTIRETPGDSFIKYLLDLKMTQALAASNGKEEKARLIQKWFENLEDLLKKIFEDDTLKLEFDEETFRFWIQIDGREPFDFNSLSSGYAAVLDIVVDLILRMQNQTGRKFDFTVPGIVLIDEIETHLHLQMQKKILNMLTTVFPNIQFIVTTHSPFILNSLPGAVIYDLEKRLYIKDGLADIPYEGIVEGYFDSDTLSSELREKFEEYKKMAAKEKLTDDDFSIIAEVELYLDEIPDYLALDVTTEYQRLKQELRNRKDI